MRLALQIHAARMRIRTAEDRLRELQAVPFTPDRLALFRAFWKDFEHDYSLVNAETTRRRIHMPLTSEAIDRIRKGDTIAEVMEAR